MSKSRLESKVKKAIEENDEEKGEGEEKFNLKKSAIGWSKDILIALVIIIVIIVALFIYTGNWPPLVVVESNSMMHGDQESNVGAIDTGDMVLVKNVDKDYRYEIRTYQGEEYRVDLGLTEITTWVEKKEKHYDNWGDVIIFKKDGSEETPVIHRAVVWLDVNTTKANLIPPEYSFDIPSLHLYGQSGTIYLEKYPAYGKDGFNNVTLELDLNALITKHTKLGKEPQSGYITKGDWNADKVDQFSLETTFGSGVYIDIVRPDWIIGKAKFEIPWFGLIKLQITGKLTDTNPAPEHTWWYLIFTLVIIVASVILIDIAIAFFSKKFKKKDDEKDEKEGDKKEKGRPKKGPPDKPGRGREKDEPPKRAGRNRAGKEPPGRPEMVRAGKKDERSSPPRGRPVRPPRGGRKGA